MAFKGSRRHIPDAHGAGTRQPFHGLAAHLLEIRFHARGAGKGDVVAARLRPGCILARKPACYIIQDNVVKGNTCAG